MNEITKPARGNNTALSEISTTLAIRLDYMRYEKPKCRGPLSAWLSNSQPGDVYQEILAPTGASRSLYGSPFGPAELAVPITMLGAGDYAVVQAAYQRFWLFSEHALLLVMERA